MSVAKRLLPLLLTAPLLALVGACVESRHPLSDEKTSKLDERLIGTWQADKMVCRVKKSADAKNSLEAETKDENGTSRALLFATTIKGKQYMTLFGLGKEAQKDRKEPYDIYQYRFVDNDTVEVRGMDPKVLRKAIAEKKLAGTSPKGDDPVITASSAELARYLEAHADECYPADTDLMLTFKRQK
ncbi:MAG: hypothetical protein ACLQLG_14760 [Thermoguttaceae bacterium]